MAKPLGYVKAFATVQGIGLLRDRGGRFISAQRQVAIVNRQLAEELQREVVAVLEGNLIRPAVSTGRLADALADPRNATADQFGWGVGNVAFLAGSAARYWKTQDLGSAAVWRHPFTGTVLRGIWGASIADMGPNGPLAGPAFTRSGAAEGGKFRPIGRRAVMRPKAKGYVNARRHAGRGSLGAIVHHEIPPKLFFQRALENIGGAQGIRNAYQRAMPGITLKDG